MWFKPGKLNAKDGKSRNIIRLSRVRPSITTLALLSLSSGEVMKELLAIHQAHTDHYRKVFVVPSIHKDVIHPKDWNWETGGTKEDFLSIIHHHGIPPECQEIFWNAMPSVPKAPEVRAELDEVFVLPPTFHQFCNALFPKSGKTAGEIAGLTYQHVQAWSWKFKQTVFDNLVSIWNSKDPPDWWKWRCLCSIPKTADDFFFIKNLTLRITQKIQIHAIR